MHGCPMLAAPLLTYIGTSVILSPAEVDIWLAAAEIPAEKTKDTINIAIWIAI